MADSGSTLIAHSDTNLVTRETLRGLAPVIPTATFKPVAHIELIESLERKLNERDILITREQFSMSKDGAKLFGTLDLTLNGIGGTCASLGLRTANNKTMSLQMIAGLRVFVCDNMAFSGETVILRRRHTSGLDLIPELVRSLNEYERHYRRLKVEVERLQNFAMDDVRAKVMLHDIFAKEIMPVRYFPAVSNVYFNEFVNNDEPKYAAFRDRNAWSLMNALTEVQKEMPLTTRIDAAQDCGEFFGLAIQ